VKGGAEKVCEKKKCVTEKKGANEEHRGTNKNTEEHRVR